MSPGLLAPCTLIPKCGSLQIVHQPDALKSQLLRHRRAVNDPRQVSGAHAVVHHGPGNPERSGRRFHSGDVDEIGHDFFQALVFAARVALIGDAHQLFLLHVEDAEVRLRSADVTCKDHATLRKTA